MKLAVILFNLGGPDRPESIEPFLRNLFSDPAILPIPWIMRQPLAWFIARRRASLAGKIYAHIGGRSPILEETEKQGRALERFLAGAGFEARCFIAMRAWHPFGDETARKVKDFAPERIVALPLYPQFSTTTTGSSLRDWDRAAKKAGLTQPTTRICCYPELPGFIEAMVEKIRAALANPRPGLSYRLLLSAHGLPKKTIAGGDPYQWQIERTAKALVNALGIKDVAVRDWKICYQSRVGPLEWLEPATDAEIIRAGKEGLGVVVAPIAFVSEHSETLVELDIEYEKLAREAGVPDYRRVPTVGDDPLFIAGLAELVRRAAKASATVNDGQTCPAEFRHCAYRRRA